jgi:hypothetical protein
MNAVQDLAAFNNRNRDSPMDSSVELPPMNQTERMSSNPQRKDAKY